MEFFVSDPFSPLPTRLQNFPVLLAHFPSHANFCLCIGPSTIAWTQKIIVEQDINTSLAQNCNVAIQELGNTSANYLEGERDF